MEKQQIKVAVSGAKLLKVMRRARGMTQQDVSESYGVCRRTYQGWESGKPAVPFDAVVAICNDVFRVSFEQAIDFVKQVESCQNLEH